MFSVSFSEINFFRLALCYLRQSKLGYFLKDDFSLHFHTDSKAKLRAPNLQKYILKKEAVNTSKAQKMSTCQTETKNKQDQQLKLTLVKTSSLSHSLWLLSRLHNLCSKNLNTAK